MKITFKKDNNSATTYYENGDININPKFIAEFGYIESITKLEAKEFIFDCKGVATGINIVKKKMEIIEKHDCERGFLSAKIVKLKYKSNHWTVFLKDFDIELYFIDYCPYCGVKLT